jgi:hypothetical protein
MFYDFISGVSGRGVKMPTHLHLVQRLKMRGAITALLQYVFMARCLIKQDVILRSVVLS